MRIRISILCCLTLILVFVTTIAPPTVPVRAVAFDCRSNCEATYNGCINSDDIAREACDATANHNESICEDNAQASEESCELNAELDWEICMIQWGGITIGTQICNSQRDSEVAVCQCQLQVAIGACEEQLNQDEATCDNQQIQADQVCAAQESECLSHCP